MEHKNQAFANQTDLEELQQDILGDFVPSSKKLNAHRDEINVVLTTPDGRLASGADDACIYLWNPKTHRARPEKIKAHSKAVWALQGTLAPRHDTHRATTHHTRHDTTRHSPHTTRHAQW